ncbi:aldehyde oxidoreductase molybdenum-binding subunit PaoC [Xylophilus sp. GOD-11R]|uniref:aldehyde oxidoreductase molybdenum-binding subunit PaoC n=1 Tax=Xylophilus sp. GOD-11R TaxID=3089814 RepID=UPI00298C40BD|nr:aldehyde oxidoreductase molybdenum-binding subunit PaoC [Xylophilus sp. GOD-11R]WPB58337.1 aldehyde oxidoreductase molybdenum-binding subunit PaoC [Xylophilus sp. GOD-11R]
MKFDTPVISNPIDRLRVVGQPAQRIDGPAKTTGTARYAYEHYDVVAQQAYGFIVGAGIGKGRIVSIDTARAKAAPGVLGVVTASEAGTLDKGMFYVAKALAGPDVDHYHQAVAIVVAETFEQARSASFLVDVRYAATAGRFDLAAARPSAVAPEQEPDTAVGDFDTAYAAAPVQVDAQFEIPDQSHAMMEPHATVAAWQGEKLTLWTAIQLVSWGTRDLAKTLGLPKENIRIVAPYIGGGFGGKGSVMADAVLAAVAARAVGRPVKVALQRPLMFNNTTHRPATLQRVRIGAGLDGRIVAIGHETLSGNLPGGMYEKAANQTRLLYAGAHRMTKTRLAVLDLPEGNAMRAPGEASGMMALEVAMDELAEKLRMDPVELRVLNDTMVDPENPARPYSIRQLVKCLRLGAERFGWSRRNPVPGQVRDGRWRVGMGMAVALRGAPVMKSGARVRLDSGGGITVETDMTDIGTGSYTILAQTAAEMMGVDLEKVTMRLGDSLFPESAGSGGQFGAASSTAGVYAACMKLREAVAIQLGFDPAEASFVDGQVREGERQVALSQAALAGDLAGEDTVEFGDLSKRYAQQTFGAHFVEVRVDVLTLEIRVSRMLAVCAAGRILNPRTARSQILGGMTMGLGAALMEELVVDKRHGFFVNHDLAGYEVPVHADVPRQEVVFLDEADPTASPLQAKGVGELGISGVGAAVSNAIYNATGARVRDYPITLDKLLKTMPT